MKGFSVILVHLVAWLVFLSLPTMFRPHHSPSGLLDVVKDIATGPRLPNTILLIAVFYFIYCVVVPRFYFKKRYAAVVLFVLLCFGALIALNYNITREMEKHDKAASPEITAPVKSFPVTPYHRGNTTFHYVGPDYNLFMFIIAVGLAFSLPIYSRMRKLSEEQLSAELSLLKAQVNPHFLFNTLNSIYSLTIARSDAAPEAVLKLSGVMRYAIRDTMQESVSLEREISYIDNYIDLQKLRTNGKAVIHFNTEGKAGGKQIAPFVLIPFVENAFKRGINPEQDCEIRVHIQVDDSKVYLDVYNKKVFVRKDKDVAAAPDISSTRQRLELLYPGRHNLSIIDNEKDFNVYLEIKLK